MRNTLNRRQFLAILIAAGMSPRIVAQVTGSSEYWISAQGKDADHFGMAALKNNQQLQSVFAGFRGHGLAQHPLRPESVMMFARRPGRKVIEVNMRNASIHQQFDIAAQRNLMGHGCFSQDGKFLFTAEADIHSGVGKIGVRDANNYQLLQELETFGIGPHEIRTMPDGKTLVVANGGILTRPETGNQELNLDSMDSNLTYIDIASGKKLQQVRVNERKASIRHIDVANDGTVVIAMQLQRQAMKDNALFPLGAVHKPGEPIKLFENPQAVIARMQDYMGSVAINSRTRLVGFTSPKGNLAAFWHLDTNEFAGYHQLVDVCGIAVTRDQSHFVITNSFGELRQLNAVSLEENQSARQRYPDTHWDNHLLSISV